MLLLLSLVTAVIALEVGLRHFYRLIPLEVCAEDFLIGNYICQPYLVYDKPIQIGYRYQPGFRFEGMWDPANPILAGAGKETRPTERNDAFWYIFETDEMGFPNREYEWRDKYDIVVTGDSFTIRTAPQTWIEILGQLTGQHILTLGAASWSTFNEVEAVKLYGLNKNPQWVILLFFEGNDIINTAQYLERRDSTLNWQEFDLQGMPPTRLLLTPHLLRFAGNKLIPDKSVTPHYRYPITASTEVGEIKTVLKDIHLYPMSASYETLAQSDEFKAVSQALLELKTLVEGQGARFLLVYVASKEHVLWSRIWDSEDVNNILERTVTVTLSKGDHGSLQWEPVFLSYDEFNQNHMAQERLMSDFALEHDIEFLNLTPIFWQESIAHGELYHFADPHWNQAGNQLAADSIFAAMQEER
jgi:hypothetical protein